MKKLGQRKLRKIKPKNNNKNINGNNLLTRDKIQSGSNLKLVTEKCKTLMKPIKNIFRSTRTSNQKSKNISKFDVSELTRMNMNTWHSCPGLRTRACSMPKNACEDKT